MEQCTLYSHKLDFDKIVEIVKAKLPQAKFKIKEDGLDKSIEATLKKRFFSQPVRLTVNYLERLNPSWQLEEMECELTQQLAGMANYVGNIKARNEQVKNQFMFRLLASNSAIPFMVQPKMLPEYLPVLKELVQALDAFVFCAPNNISKASKVDHFLDENFKLILDIDGNSEVDSVNVQINAKYRDKPQEDGSEEQINRKAASEALLRGKGVKINSHLPVGEASTEVEIRSREQIIDRAYCLMVLTAKGQGVERDWIEAAVTDKEISGFSPEETTILAETELSQQQKVNSTWRYESLNVLLWALGKLDELPYPGQICNVEQVINAIFNPSRQQFVETAILKDKAIILDELDKTYRLHWAIVDARIQGKTAAGGLDSGVVYERHYALNWLTNYLGQDWDEVSTDT